MQGQTMGTTYSVKYVDNGKVEESLLVKKIAQLLEYLDSSMSTYQAGSELNALNNAAVGEAIVVSGELWQILLIAERLFQTTGGAFDPTVGPLVDLWGFGPLDTHDVIPSQLEISALRSNVGFQHLKFLPSRQSVEKMAAIRIDLSAIAKGFAAERVAELLLELEVANFLVEVGGELRGAGLNQGGDPWRVAVEVPALARGGIQRVIPVMDRGVATSGDYRNYFERDGVRYSHTIDPRTGRPIRHNLASVTVIRKDASEADALATAYMVLGADEALEMANRDNVATLLLVKNGDEFAELSSNAFVDYIASQ
jgi:thiamine biosynthesis lipoprotein